MPKKKKKAIINVELIKAICTIAGISVSKQSIYAKSNYISSLVGCSNTSVRRVLEAHKATKYSTDWRVVLKMYRELLDEKQLIQMYKNEGKVMSTNVIRIERNVPIPKPNIGHRGPNKKYEFLTNLEVGDSFEINGNMPDYTPESVRSKAYEICKELGMTITIRTIEGSSDTPKKIRVWRTA